MYSKILNQSKIYNPLISCSTVMLTKILLRFGTAGVI